MPDPFTVAAVVIGRNEGDRLVRCLASVKAELGGIGDSEPRVVYVDSGSADGSLDVAREMGAEVVVLDMSVPFTAARARNAGVERLRHGRVPFFVQFIDGDCELQPRWLTTATAFLQDQPQVAVVCGRRRERFPEASIWNRLADREWSTPIGLTLACGGDALIRFTALDQVGGYNSELIAGEEPELCLRMRAAGWRVWRLDAEMTLHDMAMTSISQWWKRMRRGGYAAAEGMAMHGRTHERHGVATVRRALLWGFGLPGAALAGAALSPWALALLLAWPAQVVRIALRDGGDRGAWEAALFLTLAKLPEAQGVLEYHLRRRLHRPAGLIEYK